MTDEKCPALVLCHSSALIRIISTPSQQTEAEDLVRGKRRHIPTRLVLYRYMLSQHQILHACMQIKSVSHISCPKKLGKVSILER